MKKRRVTKKTRTKRLRRQRSDWSVVRSNWKRKNQEKICNQCRITPEIDPKVKFQIDHILPKKLFPELELSPDNLQRLCKDCNSFKRAKYPYTYTGVLYSRNPCDNYPSDIP